MRLPIRQVSLLAENDPDATSPEADVDLSTVTGPMLFEPLRKPWVIAANTFQLNGAGHILLFVALDHCLTSAVDTGILHAPYHTPRSRSRRDGLNLLSTLGLPPTVSPDAASQPAAL